MSETNKEELLLSKHAFGKSSGIQAALNAGAIDERDILFLDEDTNPKIGWVKKNGEVVIVETGEDDVVFVEELPTAGGKSNVIYIYDNKGYIWNGTECVPMSQDAEVAELTQDVDTLKQEMTDKVDEETVDAKIEAAMESMMSAYTVVEF